MKRRTFIGLLPAVPTGLAAAIQSRPASPPIVRPSDFDDRPAPRWVCFTNPSSDDEWLYRQWVNGDGREKY